ncbi:E3 ubiquitin-protein ligase TRIM39-like [Tiliqua scincoides]|uniref:E3 ubiquitin-protein ligase TRIM39-like n=1 Tax=Tiliqua scincoides TaxID=71010 RepID=UPI0034629670
MASASVEENIMCSICLEYMTNPVSVDCGHSFCKGCITNYCEAQEGPLQCPICKATIKKGNFRPNWQLADVVEKIKHQSPSPGKGDLCVRHKEKLHLFCKEEKEFMCLICERSPEHRSHTVLLLEEAAEEYKGRFRSSVEMLKKEREKILAYKADTKTESQDLLMQTKTKRERAAVAFRQLHQFLEEQEKLLLGQMKEVEKEIARRRDDHMAKLSEELSSLESLIREMEEKCQQPASELLQDVRSILQRYEKKKTFENPVAFPPALRWKNWEVCGISPFLECAIKEFKDILESGFHWQYENVTLDPNMAHPKLVLSKDRKSVKMEGECKDLPTWPVVLGHEGFTAGRHFWEVTVGREGRWAVGVIRKSLGKKDKFDFCPKEGVWAVGKFGDKYKVFEPPFSPPVSVSLELKRIRVTLNCDEKKVSFFDANTAVHIYTYSGISCCEETLHPCLSVKEGHLTLSP